jgi:hypothetical protein
LLPHKQNCQAKLPRENSIKPKKLSQIGFKLLLNLSIYHHLFHIKRDLQNKLLTSRDISSSLGQLWYSEKKMEENEKCGEEPDHSPPVVSFVILIHRTLELLVIKLWNHIKTILTKNFKLLGKVIKCNLYYSSIFKNLEFIKERSL